MLPSGIRMIIFDCDGVLVNSELLAMHVLLRILAKHGLEITEAEAYRRFLGRSLATLSEILRSEYRIELPDDALDDMRHELFALFREKLQPMAGLPEVLSTLPASLTTCVASSSQPDRIRLSLEVTGLLPYFDGRIFSATEVKNGKPAPDLFLHAAEQCGIAPQHCLVIEDSPSGIAAAKAAGMQVIAFTGGDHIQRAGLEEAISAAGPDYILENLRDLTSALQSAGAARLGGVPSDMLMAVDVGTASVRAGLVTADGTLVARAEKPIDVYRSGGELGTYSSAHIWAQVCAATREALRVSGASNEAVKGIGFDATCSLVVLDRSGNGLPVSPDGNPEADTIAWFDHRAMAEAQECTDAGHEVLRYSGGVISPEMEVPKLMWLKRHMPEVWQRAGFLFDLADFLTWKASGSLARSQSTLTAKWAFLAHENAGWREDFYESCGIGDVFEKGQLPASASPIGAATGCLGAEAANDLGLTTQCRVATGMVDAHAGALGILGAFANAPEDLHKHLGLVAGTSSCVMALSAERRPIPGIWGPYFGAVLPDIWLNEGGQSATGALLDHIIRWHAQGGEPTREAHERIIARVMELRALEGQDFAARLHVLPDFHGNRSPLAEPDAVGVISGLTLDSSFDSLCRLYWRTAVSIALGLRHILEALNENGYGIDTLHVAGGHTHNPLLMELYADATGCTVVTQDSYDPVIRGTAISAASAAGLHKDVLAACAAMQSSNIVRTPDKTVQSAYDRDYRAFLRMLDHRHEIDRLVRTTGT